MRATVAMHGWAGVDYMPDAIERQLLKVAADPNVAEIVLAIDSGGGRLAGVPELHWTIRSIAKVKPVTALVTGLCLSGAFYAASACSEIRVAAHALVGGLGVVWAARGERGGAYHVAAGGQRKTAGRDRVPLPAAEVAHMRACVEREYAAMVQAIALGRGVTPAAVRNSFGDGGAVGAVEALHRGMVDRIGVELDPVEISAAAAKRTAWLRDVAAGTKELICA